MNKHVVLLINLGTPNSPTTSAVRRYLSEFLNDPRVIDIPWLFRKLLVNLIIVPFRSPKSAKIYKQLWTPKGSPLVTHGVDLKNKLQESLGEEFQVELAMRYQDPHLKDVLEKIRKSIPREIIAIPLYPQYASSTTGSSVEYLYKIIGKWFVIPPVKVVGQFYDHPGFIDSIVKQANKFNLQDYNHFVFSFHGLPTRQVDKVYDADLCSDRNCETEVSEESMYCYKATCYETARLICSRLSIDSTNFTVAFQSRLDKNWLEPFADNTLVELAKAGNKKVLVFSPSFVSDCLETTIEIGVEYKELFLKHGGMQLDLVESLNSEPAWVDTLKDLALNA
ncbi:MAG: ferrochelatase [Crocinitomicaceae bacterium]|nr:ferrochelatase [Crocinitomicaceae bacterium]|tara:strand:- start:5857 stop:6864 length:1008 start_codon:yes stop_codon:yes gene_type:complete